VFTYSYIVITVNAQAVANPREAYGLEVAPPPSPLPDDPKAIRGI